MRKAEFELSVSSEQIINDSKIIYQAEEKSEA